ncbi:hypothetical protein [Nocardia sp. NPDC046763]|uniref:hypothetical protein n=1 Tax=Nocardia sp. NPDC046763 TaxID=3155256 RepID=UPI0033E5927D
MNSKKIVGAVAVSSALLVPAGFLAAPAQAEPLPLTQTHPVDVSGPASGSSSGSYSMGNQLMCALFHTSLNGSAAVPFC